MRAPGIRVNLALAMLLHNRRRLVISLSAVAFTVVIMFMEMGFFNGINDSQSRLATVLNADLVMMDHKNIHLNKFSKMDRSRLTQAMGFDGVKEVVPVFKGYVDIKNPETGLTKIIFALAFPPGSKALNVGGLEEGSRALVKPGTILFDRKSRSIFGRIEPGQLVEIWRRKFTVGGFFELGPNFSLDGTILMSDVTWLRGRASPSYTPAIAYGLIRTEPGADVDLLRRQLLEKLPPDIFVMTPEEIRQREVLHTIKAVPLGAIFGIGMVIGFVIGVIICYQILYNEITDHLPQYATLRAMGFPDRFLQKVVVQEAVWLSLIGFVPGLAFSFGLYQIIEQYTGILMQMTVGRALLILVLTTGMSICGGLIAVKRVTTADPADLY
jgi:putative ABC transport system permease protein